MQIVLLKEKARINYEQPEGYLTENRSRGYASIGIVTDAGVFRPITESRKISGDVPGGGQQWYTVLPGFLELAEDLHAMGIVWRRFR